MRSKCLLWSMSWGLPRLKIQNNAGLRFCKSCAIWSRLGKIRLNFLSLLSIVFQRFLSNVGGLALDVPLASDDAGPFYAGPGAVAILNQNRDLQPQVQPWTTFT